MVITVSMSYVSRSFHVLFVICTLGVVRRLSENGGLSPADSLGTAASGTLDGMSEVDRKQRELYTRQQQLLREQRTADQERLLATISG